VTSLTASNAASPAVEGSHIGKGGIGRHTRLVVGVTFIVVVVVGVLLAVSQPWSNEAKPDEAKPDEAKPDETKPDEAELDEAKLDEAKPDEATPDEATPDEATPDKATPDEATPDKATPDEATPDEATPDEATPDEATPDEATLDEATLDEATPDKAKPDEEPDEAKSPGPDPVLCVKLGATCATGNCCAHPVNPNLGSDPGSGTNSPTSQWAPDRVPFPKTLDLSERQLAMRNHETGAQGVEVRFIDTAHFSFMLEEGTWRDWEDKVPLVDQALSTILRRYVDELNTPVPLYKVVIFVPQASGLYGSPLADMPALSFSAHLWPELLQEINVVGVDRVANGGLLHELTHTVQRHTTPRTDDEHDHFGWFMECHSEMTRAWYSASILREPTPVGCSDRFLNCTHLYLGTTRSRYCSWLPFFFLAARHGMAEFNGLWQLRHTPDVLEAIRAALGLDTLAFNAAIFQAYLALATQGSSAPEFSNLMGASSLVEVLRGSGEASARVGGNAMVHHLRRVDGTTDQFEPFPLLEPQRLGFNAVPLHVAGTGVASFTVTLTMTVPQPNPAWVRRSPRFEPAAPQFRRSQRSAASPAPTSSTTRPRACAPTWTTRASRPRTSRPSRASPRAIRPSSCPAASGSRRSGRRTPPSRRASPPRRRPPRRCPPWTARCP